MDQGTYLEYEDEWRCHSCIRHSVLTCSIILPSTNKIFLTNAEKCYGNEMLTSARLTTRPPTFIILITRGFCLKIRPIVQN